jgi:hypothetical protein
MFFQSKNHKNSLIFFNTLHIHVVLEFEWREKFMEGKTNPDRVIMIGKINDVFDYLKECENKFVYVKDLIEALDKKKKSTHLN